MTDEKIEEELKEEQTQAAEDAQTAETSGESAENGEVCEACEGCEGGEGKKKGSKEKDKDSRKDKKKAAAEAARLETRNAELEKAIAEEKDRYARLAAEYDNYRKRTARELDGRYADAKADTWKS
ncbi:MAG: nucleotide exchange factor GrpE, partial [Clostridia bacterium]|nr:nucleotide exchange factor GrpE [Clostridia bacterium]